MALLKRQAVNFAIFDDQSSTVWSSYVGNWSHYPAQGFNNNTVTATPNPGASLSFTFSGSQVWLYGGLLNFSTAGGQIMNYPTATYRVDGTSAGSQQPWLDGEQVVYFQTPKLADGTHEIDITVSVANGTNPFIIDYFLITPSTGSSVSGVETSRSIPTSTSTSSGVPIVTTHDTPVGTIIGGVVGGVAGIAILVLAILYFLKKRSRGGQAYYFDKPSPADILATEDNVEPSDATATTPVPSSAGFTGSGRGPQSRYSDVSSNQPLNPAVRQSYVSSIPSQPNHTQPGPSEGGMTYVSGNTAHPRTGKAALISQQFQNSQQPVQYEDSGIRFSQNGVQEAGPSQLPTEVPPSYTPH